MDLLLNQGLSSVLIIILAGLVLLTVLATFLLPALLKLLGIFDIGKLKVVASTTALTVRKIKHHPVQILIGVLAVVAAALVAGGVIVYLAGVEKKDPDEPPIVNPSGKGAF